MPDQLGHYRALLSAVARLAGTDRGGAIPHHLTADMEELSVGERPALDAGRLLRRVDRLADFATTHPGLLPDNVRSPAFLADLASALPALLEREPAVWEELRNSPDLVALCHWNANVDNAWFWRDDAGALQCGLMDWGCVGRMNVAMAIWGAMCSAETDLWDHHLDELLTCFADEYHARWRPRPRCRPADPPRGALRLGDGYDVAARCARLRAVAGPRPRRPPPGSPRRRRRRTRPVPVADDDQRPEPLGDQRFRRANPRSARLSAPKSPTSWARCR